ncbi:MAG: diaminohydroxyphosphoribosylaminopyrimidine deaminase [Saprospiraceae bacterium]|jgi:diaminohydroxyphosphoribosylaminopyrimidine deaminase/5-amino-6-(5-phosphoribosylamino)uracil reductase
MQDKLYFQRCFNLAELGNKLARPNPKVGSVIVYENRIIGEGFHKQKGGRHAEVNAVNSVKLEDMHLLEKSTIYVSLEPCHHYGATPPCVDLLIKSKFPKIKIALPDPTEKVFYKSIDKLIRNGQEVTLSAEASQAKDLISEFEIVHLKKRPFIQIKMAKSADNFIGKEDGQVHLTNQYTNIFTHKLRAYTDAILIGTNTALIDNPSLTLRHFPGNQPTRVVLDREEKLPKELILLTDNLPTIVVSEKEDYLLPEKKSLIVLDFSAKDFLYNLSVELLKQNIFHLMIEGGAQLIKSFIKSDLWDEAIIIDTSQKIKNGTKAPHIHGRLHSKLKVDGDTVNIIKKIEV